MTMLSVVMPAYNEENGIREILDRVLAIRGALAEVGIDKLEVIVVDDGSTDRTGEIVQSIPDVRLVRHARNSGYGAALKTGFSAAQGEWIGFLDADGTYPPEYFPTLCRLGETSGADIVIGSRMSGSDSQMPKVRRLGNLIFARMVSLISAQKITDSASGMRVLRNTCLPMLYPLPDGLNFTPVMSMRALHERLIMVETPIPYSERIGRSKLNVIRDGIRFAQSIIWTALYYNPVRPLGLIGLVALALAAVIGLGLVGARLSGLQSVSPAGAFALFTALILAVSGVSILALGISFNYFVALFHKTPVRQGLFMAPFTGVRMDRMLGWIGSVTLLLGVAIAVVSLWLGFTGWSVTRLWIYYLASACLTLVGIQLIIAWIQMQILDTLRIREQLVADDLLGKPQSAPQSPSDTPAVLNPN